MKAVAVFPGKADTAHLAEIPEPRLEDTPGGRGVLVRVLRVGLDGTDKEINAGEYGAAPDGFDFLVLGHESFGVVEEVGRSVTELAPGDFVVAQVRRAGKCVGNDLDRDRAIEPCVTRPIDVAHSARAERRHHLIRTEPSAWTESQG